MYDLLIATDYGVYVFDSVWSLGLSSADLTRHMHSRWGDGNGQPGSERRYRSAEDIISSVNTEECPRTSCTPHEHRALKAVEKDPSATVVANVRLTGATVVGSVNATEFWQRRTRPPSFLLLSVAQWILEFLTDPLFALATKWYIIITVFATVTIVLASFTDVLYSIGTTSNKTDAVPRLFQ